VEGEGGPVQNLVGVEGRLAGVVVGSHGEICVAAHVGSQVGVVAVGPRQSLVGVQGRLQSLEVGHVGADLQVVVGHVAAR